MPNFPLRNVQCLIQWWLVDNWAQTAFNVGFVLSFITILEFAWAQSPCPFCGLSTGITIKSTALSAFIGYGIHRLVVGIISISNTHVWFYSNLSIAFIMFLYVVVFHCISKQYKLRKRDDIVPVHLFAKEFVETEIRGRERLYKERSS